MLRHFLLLRRWKRVENVPLPKFDFDIIFFYSGYFFPEKNKD